jgi:hypothetical protein
MKDQVDLLIEVLYDKTAREDEREEAACYLGSYNDDRALEALVTIGSDSCENDFVLDSCGVSIADIMIKRNQYSPILIRNLAPTAKQSALGILKGEKPEWTSQFE